MDYDPSFRSEGKEVQKKEQGCHVQKQGTTKKHPNRVLVTEIANDCTLPPPQAIVYQPSYLYFYLFIDKALLIGHAS